MKNKLLLLNIISYIILYHLVYEFIGSFFNNKDHPTPLGYYLFYENKESFNYKSHLLALTISFLFNLSVSLVFWIYLYNLYVKFD